MFVLLHEAVLAIFAFSVAKVHNISEIPNKKKGNFLYFLQKYTYAKYLATKRH